MVGNDGLVVALDGEFNDSDGRVAGIVDIDSVKVVGPTCRSVNNRQHRATRRHFRVVERVEVAGQHDRR